MSDDEQKPSGSNTELKMLTAEIKDGQLQIVEMAPYDKESDHLQIQTIEGHLIDGSESSNDDMKYIQVLNSGGKDVMVDLLNLTLVRSEDGQESYRVVSNLESESGSEDTVTCVLSNDDTDDPDAQEYVMVESDDGPLVILQSSLQHANPADIKCEVEKSQESITPTEILERAKALQKAKQLTNLTPKRGPGRRRKGDLPPPHELLSSPHFKLFLYSCKLCSFRCNAIKELTAHKAAEHSSMRVRSGGRGSAITMQCARCPYRGNSYAQLMKHVKDKHIVDTDTKELLNSEEVDMADILVCGACGFECSHKNEFRKHIEDEHGSMAC